MSEAAVKVRPSDLAFERGDIDHAEKVWRCVTERSGLRMTHYFDAEADAWDWARKVTDDGDKFLFMQELKVSAASPTTEKNHDA